MKSFNEKNIYIDDSNDNNVYIIQLAIINKKTAKAKNHPGIKS